MVGGQRWWVVLKLSRDRLKPDGTESIELGAIGLLEPNFSSDPWVQEELAKYRSNNSVSA